MLTCGSSGFPHNIKTCVCLCWCDELASHAMCFSTYVPSTRDKWFKKKKKDGYNDLKCKNRNKYLELTSM